MSIISWVCLLYFVQIIILSLYLITRLSDLIERGTGLHVDLSQRFCLYIQTEYSVQPQFIYSDIK